MAKTKMSKRKIIVSADCSRSDDKQVDRTSKKRKRDVIVESINFDQNVTVIISNDKQLAVFLSVGCDKQLANRRRYRPPGFPWKGEDMIRKLVEGGAVAFALTVAAASMSSAATCGSGLTGVGNFVEGQTACVTGNTIGTAGGGNPEDSYVDMFGMGKTWNVLNPTNLGQPQAEGGNTILQFSGFSVSPDNGGTVSGAGTEGTWSVTSWPANTLIAFALKGGSPSSGGGSTFHLMDQSTTSGKWYMNPNGLSNFRVFATAAGNGPPPPPVAPVPLPAAGWMLLAAIGGMAFWRRRATA